MRKRQIPVASAGFVGDEVAKGEEKLSGSAVSPYGLHAHAADVCRTQRLQDIKPARCRDGLRVRAADCRRGPSSQHGLGGSSAAQVERRAEPGQHPAAEVQVPRRSLRRQAEGTPPLEGCNGPAQHREGEEVTRSPTSQHRDARIRQQFSVLNGDAPHGARDVPGAARRRRDGDENEQADPVEIHDGGGTVTPVLVGTDRRWFDFQSNRVGRCSQRGKD